MQSGEQCVEKPKRRRSPAVIHKETIYKRMAQGEPLSVIAQDYGYTGAQGIEERLGDEPAYKAAMRAGIRSKIEKRERELEASQTNVEVTRADRLLGHARWWAERLDPERFAQKQEINHHVSIVKALEAIAVIEGEVIHSAAAQLPQSNTSITVEGESRPVEESGG